MSISDRIERAARVILDACQARRARYPMMESVSVEAAREYAQALDRAGLLAPCDGLLGQQCHVEVKREFAMNLRKQFTWTDIRDDIDRSEGGGKAATNG